MDLDNQVKARYENGETVREIAEDIGTTFGTVCNILNNRNVRTMSEAAKSAKAEGTEVCRRYEAGESSRELAESFGVHSSTIHDILKRHGVKIRSVSQTRGGLTDEQEAEVCRRYKAGGTTTMLARVFGVSAATIHKLIRRNLGTLR